MSRNLAVRISVALIAIPIILWFAYRGQWWLFGMVALLAAVAILEFLIREGQKPGGLLFWVVVLTMAALFYALASGSLPGGWDVRPFASSAPLIFLAFFIMSGVLISVGRDAPDLLFRRYTRLVWGVLYVGALYPFVFLLGQTVRLPYADSFTGGDCLLFLFGLLWVGDTAAMAVGSWFGRRRLAPGVSPNKTIEGFVGGLAGALAIGVIMVFWKFRAVAWYHVLVVAGGCSVLGQLGDLVESAWKRSLGIKDSSAIIPGHGGVLDRFDSLLFAAPFMYFYLRAFITG
ncbi:MAG TPA: phosphatidate cytidylyltransferase [Acidobacteriota bacterium]|nr:phosphatidate cytidylyltransferase [Acidobacteriota bacterium]